MAYGQGDTIRSLEAHINAQQGTINELSKMNDMLEDSSSYWKEQFEDLYNRLVRIVNTPGEEYTDGECIDAIYNLLYSHEGQSDEQIDIDTTL